MAVPTPYYVDPSLNANSGTGTSGDPFGDLQYALNTVTRDATNGDIFHIKAGTAEVLAASLSFTTYGAPTWDIPVAFQGYTSTAGDGGIGVIDGNGSYAAFSNNLSGFVIKNIKFQNSGSTYLVDFYSGVGRGLFSDCVFDATGITQTAVRATCTVFLRCSFINFSATAVQSFGNSRFYFNTFKTSVLTSGAYLLYCGERDVVFGNMIWLDDGSSGLAIVCGSNIDIINNTIFCIGSGISSHGIATGDSKSIIIFNNYVEGLSGSGSDGMNFNAASSILITGHNKAYNCATSFTKDAIERVDLGGDATLSASGLVDGAGGDFTPTADLEDSGYPVSFPAF